MPNKINVTSRTMKRIRHSGKTLERVDPALVAKQLGAELVEPLPRTGSPMTLLAVRQELAERLESTGGRPSLRGAKRRQKVPLSDTEWNILEKIAALLTKRGLKTTAGQVAGILLHQAIKEIESSADEERKVVGKR